MFIPPACIDTLFDYLPLLQREALCELPYNVVKTKRVAIIGAGACGLLAAHELLKMGIRPTIYEASNRMGGRLYSEPFKNALGNEPIFAELGAMRIPKSSQIFYHYAKKLDLQVSNLFPDPGVVDTTIYYKNNSYFWRANRPPPAPFDQIKLLWELFSLPMVEQITTQWKQGNIDVVVKLWQYYINQYKDLSFYEVLKSRSLIASSEQLHQFGALGIGTGGFSPLFSMGFLEILRIMVNAYEENQLIIENGIEEFAKRLYELPVQNADAKTSLKQANCLRLQTPVIKFDYNQNTQNPIIYFRNNGTGEINAEEYDAVIFTGSIFAAQHLNLTDRTSSGAFLLDSEVRKSIRNSFMIASSKTFIRTPHKFWLNQKMPVCILTDELPRAIYFLDYPNTEEGVVCLSYTWGIDSIKLIAVDPADRVRMFRATVESISPEINKHLNPADNEIITIDWLSEKYQGGAFKLILPGNDEMQKHLYYQFQSALSSKLDSGVYLAGDSISWSGGWVEGALYTAINSVFAVAKRFQAELPTPNPLMQKPNLFNY